MKQIKFLLAIALVSVFVISCKETPKVEDVQDAATEVVETVEETTTDAVEAAEVAVDSTAAAVKEVIEEVKE